MRRTSLLFLLAIYLTVAARSQVAFRPSPFGPEGPLIRAVAVDSTGIMYASGEGVYRSTNGGASWILVNANTAATSLAADGHGILYAGSGAALLMSGDGGTSWSPIGSNISGQLVTSITVDSASGVYVGTNQGLFYSSGSVLPFLLLGIPDGTAVYSLDINSDGWVFAGTSSGVFRSTDGGRSWQFTRNGFSNVLSLRKSSFNTYFAISPTGIFRSTDRCTTWLRVSERGDGNGLVVLQGGGLVVSTNSSGILRSTDSGDTWGEVNDGLAVRSLIGLTVRPDGPIFAGSISGIYASTDRGAQWTAQSAGLGYLHLKDFTVSSSGTFFAGSTSGLWQSLDNGTTWHSSSSWPVNQGVNFLRPGIDGQLFAGTSTGLYRSTDDGATWIKLTTGAPFSSVDDFAIFRTGQMLASSYPRLYRSTDDGTSWVQVFEDSNFGPVISLNAIDQTGYALKSARLYRTTDYGSTWVVMHEGFVSAHNLAVNGVGHLFVSDDVNGTLRSMDCGEHWTPVLTAPPGYASTHVAIGPNGHVVVADNAGNVFISPHNGETWSSVGSMQVNFVRLLIDASGFLFGATSGNGIFISNAVISPPRIPNIFIPSGADLGREQISEMHYASFPIYNIGSAPLSDLSFVVSDTAVHVHTLTSPIPGYSLISCEFDYRVKSLGPGREWIAFHSSEIGQTDTAFLYVYGFGVAQARFSPASLQFGQVYYGASKDTVVIIENDGDDTLRVEGAHSTTSTYTLQTVIPPIPPGDSTSGRIRFTPGAVGPHIDHLIFSTNSASTHDSLPVAGTGRAIGILRLTSSRFDFGYVPLGSRRDTLLRVQNVGTDTAIVYAIEPADTAFSIPHDTLAVAPGVGRDVVVGYKPWRFGQDSTELGFISNALTPSFHVTAIGSSPAPTIEVSPQGLDFGEIQKGWSKSMLLTITNRSWNPVLVDSIRTRRSSFVVDTSLHRVPAHDSVRIIVAFRPDSNGTFMDTVFVRSNATTPLVEIPLMGISPQPRLEASINTIDFGAVGLGSSAEISFSLTSRFSNAPIIVTEIRKNLPVFSVEETPPLLVNPGDSVHIRVRYSPQEYKTNRDTLQFVWDRGSLDVPIVGVCPRALPFVSAARVDFGQVPLGWPKEDTLVITNPSASPLPIDSIFTSTALFGLISRSVVIAPHDSFNVAMAFYAATYGEFGDTLTILSNTQWPHIDIPLSAVVPPPAPVFVPSTIAFGNVPPGSTRQYQFGITNTSISQLRVDSLWTHTSYFSVVKFLTNNIVNKGDTTKIAVRFTPNALHEYLDTLWVASSAPSSPVCITLLGTGSNALSVNSETAAIPKEYFLFQNYPNPFNPTTDIWYQLPVAGEVRIVVYDMLGREMHVLVNERKDPGNYQVKFNAAGLSSGTYIYRLTAGDFVQTRKMVLVK